MYDFLNSLWTRFFSEGAFNLKEAILFFSGFMIGAWHERWRAKTMIEELGKLLKKKEIRDDICTLGLTEDEPDNKPL